MAAAKNKKKKTATSKSKRFHFLKRAYLSFRTKQSAFLERRPHRTLRRTSKTALPITAPLPGNIALIRQTLHTMRRFRRQYIYFGLIFIVFNIAVIGLVQQQNYQFFSDTIKTVSEEVSAGEFGNVAQVATLFGVAVTGGLNGDLSETQQFSLAFASIMLWLSIIWFLRNRLQGNEISVRDAIYNAGAPIVPMIILSVVALLQLLPGGIGILAYGIAQTAGINGGVEQMMFGIAGILLLVLSLYWVVSTIIATMIITIPGTYPIRALKLASDIVLQRRLKVLVRIMTLLLAILVVWLIILFPTLLIAGWIKLSWLPLVLIVLQVLAAYTLLTFATYMYLLYRRMLDEPER